MEYIFGTVQRGGVNVDNLKTVGTEHSDLSGKVNVVKKYNDNEITEVCDIVEKYHSAESEGVCYDWYYIKNYFRVEDKFTPGIVATEQEITDHDLAIIEAEQEITELDLKIWEIENSLEV